MKRRSRDQNYDSVVENNFLHNQKLMKILGIKNQSIQTRTYGIVKENTILGN